MEGFSPLQQGLMYLLQFSVGMVIFALLLRFLMRATYADWRHPIVTFTAKVTNPICAPINAFMPTKGRWDLAALITAFILQGLFYLLVSYIDSRSYGVGIIIYASIIDVFNQLLDMMFWLIVIQAVLSWVSPQYNPNTAIFVQMTQPILDPFRKFIPPVGGIDLTPIAAIVAIKLVQIVVIGGLTQALMG